jgi:ornithine carbamoyltransferase
MPPLLDRRRVALWFDGQGFGNRVAFEIGARSMGADVTIIPGTPGTREPMGDVGRYLGNWFSMAFVRAAEIDHLRTFAALVYSENSI